MRLAPGSRSAGARAVVASPPQTLEKTRTADDLTRGTFARTSNARLGGDRARAGRWFPLAAAALVVATVVTRLLFMTQTLYAFDSANYALAVRDFYNVAFHQPHPPGYPLYVFFAKAIDLVVPDANRALVLEGIAWSALAVGCTIALARAMFGRATGLLAGLLLVCTVGFWGYGEVAYPYVALAGETAALALLTHQILEGRQRTILALAAVWAVSLGVRWDAAVFDVPLALWALWTVPWRLRFAAVAVALAIVTAWAVPMIILSGGWDVYRQVLADYLRVWSPQSAYVVGDFASGGDTQATYNLNFLVNYLRQMLGIGLLLVLYLFGRRFAPAVLAADYRSRLLALWTVPPLVVYVFAHLGESGYVLSLAPQAAILIGMAIFELRDDFTQTTNVLRARGWHWLPPARLVGACAAAFLSLAIVGWNVQAFARGVGPGRLPDLRAHDATTAAQIEFLKQQPVGSTFVLAHDIFRQLHYYAPEYRADLLFSEYVPNFQTALTRTDLPPGTSQIVVLDSSLKVAPENAAQASEIVLRQQPHVSVWLVNVEGATAVEHGYQYLRLMR
jgi:Dolichyl-phosphate-mannose-protein mannosyltransferase